MEDDELETSYYDSMEEHYKSLGRDHREWDRSYYCLRRSSDGLLPKHGVYVHRDTLKHPLRIEALRWKILGFYSNHMDRIAALIDEVWASPDHECFIPHDPVKFAEMVRESKARGEPLSEEEIEGYSFPRRVISGDNGTGLGLYATYDDDFWDYKQPKFDREVAMEVIAAAGHQGKWEQAILPKRVKRAEDPAKLDLGRRYKHETDRGFHITDKCWLLNAWLAGSILNSDLLPEGPPNHQKLVKIWLNKRLYYFKVGRHHKSADYDLWPSPGDEEEITVSGPFEPAGAVP